MERFGTKGPDRDAHIESLRSLADVIIFTTTLYKEDGHSRVRQALCLKLLDNASRLGIRTVLVDGGSNPDFLAQARTFRGVTILPQSPGSTMGAGRRQALEEALHHDDASVFLWVEPEKDTLINERSLGDMVERIKAGDADIVVPRRTSTESLPKFQRWIEARANARADTLIDPESQTQESLDLWFGPKMFNREGAGYFLEYSHPSMDKWDSIIAPVINAHRDGKKIASVDVDYTYDPSQTDAEEHDPAMKARRVDQYRQIFASLGDDFWNREGKGMEGGEPKTTDLTRVRDS